MKKNIYEILNEKKVLISETQKSDYAEKVEAAVDIMVEELKLGNKIILAGNGGSAADAQHFAGEIVGRFLFDRPSAPAISLCTDSSVMTCIANDYGYDEVFARQIEGLGKEGDTFIAISTSGNSANIISAIKVAKEKKIHVIGLLGNDGGAIRDMCDVAIVIHSDSTPRIQEFHTFTVHMICQFIERKLFSEA